MNPNEERTMTADQKLCRDVREFVSECRANVRMDQREHLASMRRVRDAGQQSSVYFLHHYEIIVQEVAACDRWLAGDES